MKDDSHLYIDVETLRQRGWTETLVKRFLNAPDRWESVNHYRNFTGKRTYFLGRIQVTEALPEFHDAFLRSIKRRKLTTDRLNKFLNIRKVTEKEVQKWLDSLTKEDIRIMSALKKAAECLDHARCHGLRTPHK